MSDRELEAYRALRESQNRYAYYMLAVAAAAIALSLERTSQSALSWSQLPLGAAVLSWGFSFLAGTFHLRYVSSNLYANTVLLQVQGGVHPKVGTDEAVAEAAIEGLRMAIATNSDRTEKWGRWQTQALIGGAIFYTGWHVLEMYLRTLRI